MNGVIADIAITSMDIVVSVFFILFLKIAQIGLKKQRVRIDKGRIRWKVVDWAAVRRLAIFAKSLSEFSLKLENSFRLSSRCLIEIL